MFTGLIETIGRVVSADRTAGGVRLRVDLGPAADGARPGDSVNLSGACQTVAAVDGPVADFDTVAETLARTTLGGWAAGTAVNVERSLRPGDRLGGHFVAGHVDATGRVIDKPEIAPKGSIAVDGVSLTVVEAEPPAFTVALIPTTLRETTLGLLATGDRVNLETDLLAKYVRRALAAGTTKAADRRLMEALERAGFLDEVAPPSRESGRPGTMKEPPMPTGAKPRLAVTVGDPAGIGPEVTARALADEAVRGLAHVAVFGPPAEVWARRAGVPLPPLDAVQPLQQWDGTSPAWPRPRRAPWAARPASGTSVPPSTPPSADAPTPSSRGPSRSTPSAWRATPGRGTRNCWPRHSAQTRWP